MKISDGPLEVEALMLTHVPPDSEQKRGHRTYNGLNLTVRRYGAVVANYRSMTELAEHWPALAELLAEQIKQARS